MRMAIGSRVFGMEPVPYQAQGVVLAAAIHRRSSMHAFRPGLRGTMFGRCCLDLGSWFWGTSASRTDYGVLRDVSLQLVDTTGSSCGIVGDAFSAE